MAQFVPSESDDRFVMPPCPVSLSVSTLTREEVLDPRVGIGLPLFMRTIRAFLIESEPRPKTAVEIDELQSFVTFRNFCNNVSSTSHLYSQTEVELAKTAVREIERANEYIVRRPRSLYPTLRRAVNKALLWYLQPPTE
jgi:hypothetical protein